MAADAPERRPVEPVEPAGDGLLVVDKPAGWTSHDVVGRVRRLALTRRVGHAGTLDPMATGVLVLGVNRGTKLLTFLVGLDKGYAATVRLGRATATDDAEGEVTASTDAGHLTDEQVETAVRRLTGDLEQVPSAVSAIKVDGRRAYARVRAGEAVELAARPVTVSRFVVLARRDAQLADGTVVDLDIEVDVSSGTYVRALARDLGRSLGVGGHLIALRRTRIGDVRLDRAVTLAELEVGGVPAHLVHLADAARVALPTRELTEAEARALGYGQRIGSARPGRTGPVAALGPDGRLVAVLDETGTRARSLVVLAPSGQ